MTNLPLRRRSRLPVVVLAVLSAVGALLIGLLAATQPAQATPTAPGVYLYDNWYYGGRALTVCTGGCVGSDMPDLGRFAFNDITSSVLIVGNYRVTLYENINYTGGRSTITGACNWIGGNKTPLPLGGSGINTAGCITEFPSPKDIGNDQVSSVIVRPLSGLNPYAGSSRLVYPSGIWANAGGTAGWHFYPDGSYTATYCASIYSSNCVLDKGNFSLGYYLNPVLSWAPAVSTYNNRRVYGNPNGPGSPEVNSSFDYYYKNSDTISMKMRYGASVIQGLSWLDWHFKATSS